MAKAGVTLEIYGKFTFDKFISLFEKKYML